MSNIIKFEGGSIKNGGPKNTWFMEISAGFTNASIQFDNEHDGNGANCIIKFRADQDLEVNGAAVKELLIRITGTQEMHEFFCAMTAFHNFHNSH